MHRGFNTSLDTRRICGHCKHWDRDGRGNEHYTGDPDVPPVELSQRRCRRVVTYDGIGLPPSASQVYLTGDDANRLWLFTPEEFHCAGFERR